MKLRMISDILIFLIGLLFVSSCRLNTEPATKTIQNNTLKIDFQETFRDEMNADTTESNHTWIPEQEPFSIPSETSAFLLDETDLIDKDLKDRVAEMNCSDSINRFRESVKISQSKMSTEEILRLLIDQNIVCFYTFKTSTLIYDDQNYNDEGYSSITHYLFSSYSELNDFVYSTYEEKYAAELLSNLYGYNGELYRGDDSCILYNPSVQGIDVLAGNLFSEYTCRISKMSENRITFSVIFTEDEESSWVGYAIMQNGEWRLEKMLPDIQRKNPNVT